MNLKILFMLGLYYTILSLTFFFGDGVFLSDYTSTFNINDTNIGTSETDTGGLFSTGVSFGRFFLWVGFGVGLPDTVPSWFGAIFIAWQSLLTLFTVGFIISSIWNG